MYATIHVYIYIYIYISIYIYIERERERNIYTHYPRTGVRFDGHRGRRVLSWPGAPTPSVHTMIIILLPLLLLLLLLLIGSSSSSSNTSNNSNSHTHGSFPIGLIYNWELFLIGLSSE